MKSFRWNEAKNSWLKETRGISFEDAEKAILQNGALAIEQKKNPKYIHQKIFVVEIYGYAYGVPFVEDEKSYFLKTIYPDRKFTKKYLKKGEI